MVIYVEAAGCPDTCRHCSADGRPPVGSYYTVDDLIALRQEWGPLNVYHEPTAHSQFPVVYHSDIIEPHGGYLVSNCYGLAHRVDIEQVFQHLNDDGIRTITSSLHGFREHHDWFVNRRGAFDDIVLAGRKAKAAGFEIRWQIYLDKINLRELSPLVDFIFKETEVPPQVSIPAHRVSRRLWAYEKLRPNLSDVRTHPLAGTVKSYLGDLPEDSTGGKWLERWRENPCGKEFRHPFEPPAWPPNPEFAGLTFYLRRDRRVYFDPMCAPPIYLGHLAESKDALLARLQTIPAPVSVDIKPDTAQLSALEADLLHPIGASLRYKVISIAHFTKTC